MKKMVCEICESQSIKKENGIFICQECGTEYSLEDAKKLLKEIPENNIVKSENITTTTNDTSYSERNQKKGELLNVLLMWANVIKVLSEQKDFEFDLSSPESWDGSIGKCLLIHQLGENYNNKEKKDSYLLNDVYFRGEPYPTLNGTFGFISGFKKNIEYSIYILSKIKDKVKTLLDFMNTTKNNCLAIIEEKKQEIYKLHKNADIYDTMSNALKDIMGFEIVAYYSESSADIMLQDNKELLNELTRDEVVNYLKVLNLFTIFHDSSFENYFDCKEQFPLINLNAGKIKFTYKKLFVEKYESINVDFSIDLDGLKSICKDINNAYEIEAKKFIEKIDNIIDYNKKYIVNAIDFSKELSKEFNLPIKYRNLNSILPLIELVLDGRAETWMEAINLFEDEKFKVKLLDKIDNVSARIDQLSKSINALYMETQRSNRLQELTNLQLNKLNRQINFANRLEMYKQFDIV